MKKLLLILLACIVLLSACTPFQSATVQTYYSDDTFLSGADVFPYPSNY